MEYLDLLVWINTFSGLQLRQCFLICGVKINDREQIYRYQLWLTPMNKTVTLVLK